MSPIPVVARRSAGGRRGRRGDPTIRSGDPRKWTECQLSAWLLERGLPGEIAHAFEAHLVNGLLGVGLSQEDLVSMGICDTLHQRRVVLELQQLFGRAQSPVAAVSVPPSCSPASDAPLEAVRPASPVAAGAFSTSVKWRPQRPQSARGAGVGLRPSPYLHALSGGRSSRRSQPAALPPSPPPPVPGASLAVPVRAAPQLKPLQERLLAGVAEEPTDGDPSGQDALLAEAIRERDELRRQLHFAVRSFESKAQSYGKHLTEAVRECESLRDELCRQHKRCKAQEVELEAACQAKEVAESAYQELCQRTHALQVGGSREELAIAQLRAEEFERRWRLSESELEATRFALQQHVAATSGTTVAAEGATALPMEPSLGSAAMQQQLEQQDCGAGLGTALACSPPSGAGPRPERTAESGCREGFEDPTSAVTHPKLSPLAIALGSGPEVQAPMERCHCVQEELPTSVTEEMGNAIGQFDHLCQEKELPTPTVRGKRNTEHLDNLCEEFRLQVREMMSYRGTFAQTDTAWRCQPPPTEEAVHEQSTVTAPRRPAAVEQLNIKHLVDDVDDLVVSPKEINQAAPGPRLGLCTW